MTEQEWLVCSDPDEMLLFLRQPSLLTERKSRLFGVAACFRIWHLLTDERSRRAVELVERFADGEATTQELNIAYEAAFEVGAALAERNANIIDALRSAAWAASSAAHPNELAEGVALEAADASDEDDEQTSQCRLIHDIFGNPFHPANLDRSWLIPEVVTLAKEIYDKRAFDRMPALAEALEQAGCKNTAVLAHCRGPGPHVKACWVVDAVLGKE